MDNTCSSCYGSPIKKQWVLALVVSSAFLFMQLFDTLKVSNSNPILFLLLWIVTWGSLFIYFLRTYKLSNSSPVKKGLLLGMAGIVLYILSDIWLLLINIIFLSADADTEFFANLHQYVFGGLRVLSEIFFISCYFCLTKAFWQKTLQKSISLILALCYVLSLLINICFIIDPRIGLFTTSIPLLIYSLLYICLIAFIIVTSLPAFVEWLASADSITTTQQPIVETNGAPVYKPNRVFPNSHVAGAALILCIVLGILAALIKFESSRFIGFAFSPIPAALVAAVISILMLVLTLRNKKDQIALGYKNSTGGAMRCYSITLCLTWLCMLIALILFSSSNFRDIEDVEGPNILVILGVVFLLVSIISGFASSSKPADGISVLALIPLLGLSMLSDIIASLINGCPVIFNFADENVSKISFIIFAIINAIAAIVHLASQKPRQPLAS